MFYRKSKNLSYLLSIASHLILLLLFMFINFTIEHEEDEYVTIGFGTMGQMSSSGIIGNETNRETDTQPPQREITRLDDKKIEVPLTQNVDTENIITKSEKKQEENIRSQTVKPLKTDNQESAGRENTGSGEGSFGFEIDFGGKGKRRIYSYILPEYPSGVSKEIDVKLRFSILPDGTVGKIFPLIKADTKLEMAAINSLRQWRFEPLPSNSRQIE